MKSRWTSNIARVGVVLATAATLSGATMQAASASDSDATAEAPEQEASNSVDLPEHGDVGYLNTREYLPTTICAENKGDPGEYSSAYLYYTTPATDVDVAQRLTPGRLPCTTRFFGGQKVKVENEGETPIYVYRK